MPVWLVILSWVCVGVGMLSAAVIVMDELAGHAQHMWIMNVVWPLTGLWAGPLGLWAYFHWGRLSTHRAMMAAKREGREPPAKGKPFWAATAVAVTHCGGGCTLGDILAEWGVFFFPAMLACFGYRTLFPHPIFAAWILDFIVAFLLGICFQYFTIAPMKHLGVAAGLWAAVKADALSLAAWQVGMYGWMAIAVFAIFHHEIPKTSPVFWFMMQFAMMVGFATSYPVNWWLLRAGLKEKM